MSAKSRARHQSMVQALIAYNEQPAEFAVKMFDLIGESVPSEANLTVKDVVLVAGALMSTKRILLQDIEEWARKLFTAAGLDFDAPVVEPEPVVPAPTKRVRPYLAVTTESLEAGTYTQKELVAHIAELFPNIKKATVEQFVTDLQNPKYNVYKDRQVVKQEGRLVFA